MRASELTSHLQGPVRWMDNYFKIGRAVEDKLDS